MQTQNNTQLSSITAEIINLINIKPFTHFKNFGGLILPVNPFEVNSADWNRFEVIRQHTLALRTGDNFPDQELIPKENITITERSVTFTYNDGYNTPKHDLLPIANFIN